MTRVCVCNFLFVLAGRENLLYLTNISYMEFVTESVLDLEESPNSILSVLEKGLRVN